MAPSSLTTVRFQIFEAKMIVVLDAHSARDESVDRWFWVCGETIFPLDYLEWQASFPSWAVFGCRGLSGWRFESWSEDAECRGQIERFHQLKRTTCHELWWYKSQIKVPVHRAEALHIVDSKRTCRIVRDHIDCKWFQSWYLATFLWRIEQTRLLSCHDSSPRPHRHSPFDPKGDGKRFGMYNRDDIHSAILAYPKRQSRQTPNWYPLRRGHLVKSCHTLHAWFVAYGPWADNSADAQSHHSESDHGTGNPS